MTFSVTAWSGTSLSYQWYFGSSAISGATSSSLTLNNVTSANAGNYYVTVINGGGSVNSSTATLTVNVPVLIATQPTNQVLVQGQNAAFTVVAGGTSPFTYQWYFNGSSLGNSHGARTATYSLNNVDTSKAGNYWVVVNNNYGSVTSVVVTLAFYVPPTITTQPTNRALVVGQNATFAVVALGTPILTYQWKVNGTNIAGATNASLTLNNIHTTDAASYSVVLTNSWGSTTSAVATLTVYLPTTITTQPQSEGVAKGQNASFSVGASGTAPLTYQWYFGNSALGGNQSATNTLINVDTSKAGNYWVVVTGAGGPATSAVATLTVYVLPGIQTQPHSQAVLQGQTATFSVVTNNSGTPPFYYQWNVSGTNTVDGSYISGSTNATLTLSNVQPAQAVNVFVVITNNAGSITSAVASLTVNVPAFITNQPVSQTLIQGQSTTFTVGAGGTSPLSYQWRLTGTNLASATNASLTLTNLQPANAGSYSVVVTNIAGSVTSSVAALMVFVPPAITNQPQSLSLVPGGNATFAVGASGTAPLNYQWSLNGANLSGATNTSLTLTNIDPTDAGSYSVVVSNYAGSVTSAVATLNIMVPVAGSYFEAVVTNSPLAYWRLDEFSGTTAFDCIGRNNATYTNVTLNQASALATDSDPSAAFNGTNAYAGTSVRLLNNLPAFTLEGWFKLKAATSRMGLFGQNDAIEFGFVATNTIQVYTGNGGSLTLTNLWSNNSWHHIAAVGNGTNLIMYVDGNLAGSGGTATNNYGSSTYPFNIGGGGVFDAATNWFNGGLDEIAVYGHALAATDIKRHYLLGLALPTIVLTAPTNNATFTPPATISLAANVVTNGHTISQVQFFNGATLLNQDLVAPYTYSWSGVGLGTYSVSAVAIYDMGSVTSSVTTVTVFSPPAITTPPQSQTVILGQSAVFSVIASGSLPLAYRWKFNGTNIANGTNASLTIANAQTTNAGNYTVVVTNMAGSVTSAVAVLTVYVPATITSQPASQALILGQNATFSVGVSGTAPLNYQWSVNGTIISYGTNASLTLTNIQPTDAASYAVVVTNIAGSVTSSVATLTVYVPPTITTPPQNLAVVQGQTAVFSVAASGTSPLAYQWKFNGTNISRATNSMLTLTNIQTTSAGNYAVTVTNIAGSVLSAVAALTVYVPPTITNQPASQALILGQNATFTVGASGTTPLTYQWSVNGTNLYSGTNASLTITNIQTTDATSYSVVVTNIAGSATSAVATLTVYVPPTITTQPQSQGVTQGQNVSLTVAASGSSPFTYQWYFNGSKLGGASTGSSCILNNISMDKAGDYTVVVANAGGSATSSVATLTVYVPPAATTLPAGNITTNSVTLNATVNPQGAAASYYFQFGVTTNYGSFTPTNSLLAGTNDVAASVTFSGLTPGTQYHYSVVVASLGGTTFGADANFTTAYLPPAATTLTAENVTTDSATLTATVNPQGTAASYYFQYGLTTNYDSFSATNALAADSNFWSVATLVAGLAPGTAYHYSVVAVSAGGTSIGADATFSTAFLPPMATTLAVSNVTASSAELAAAVNPQGAAATYYFQIGVTTNYGLFTVTNILAAGSNSVGVTTPIAGLSPGTLYHYLIVAASSGGMSFGQDATFSTLTVPPALVTGTLPAAGGNMALLLTSVTGAAFTVLASTNAALPLSQWTIIGSMTETSPGQYQFTDAQAPTNAQYFYIIRSP